MIRKYIRHNKDTTSENFPHGEFAGYRAGCKCKPCNAANNTKKRMAYRNKEIEKEIVDPNFKVCGGCEIKKPILEFYTQEKYLSSYCKECETPRRKKYLYLREYNLTIDEFLQILDNQNNLCAICNREFQGREPFVDHCHITNKVRGLLCTKCNFGIGHFNDSIVLLTSAISYLKNSAADCPSYEGVSSN